jgi:hypothetical protein
MLMRQSTVDVNEISSLNRFNLLNKAHLIKKRHENSSYNEEERKEEAQMIDDNITHGQTLLKSMKATVNLYTEMK